MVPLTTKHYHGARKDGETSASKLSRSTPSRPCPALSRPAASPQGGIADCSTHPQAAPVWLHLRVAAISTGSLCWDAEGTPVRVAAHRCTGIPSHCTGIPSHCAGIPSHTTPAIWDLSQQVSPAGIPGSLAGIPHARCRLILAAASASSSSSAAAALTSLWRPEAPSAAELAAAAAAARRAELVEVGAATPAVPAVD